jgi:glycosyltransferase involved in cell wall biosynthesis
MQTLDSLIADDSGSKEIIVIDDGSRDESFAKIEAWRMDHPSVKVKAISRPNRGVAATLNELLLMSEGQYIRVCASDDLITPGSSVRLINHMKNTGKTAVFGDCLVIDDNGREIGPSSLQYKKSSPEAYQRNLSRAIINEWAVVGPSILYARSAFKDEHFDESLVIEDWDFYLRLLARDELAFLNETVAQYRVHSTNTSITTNREARIKNLSSQWQAARKNTLRFSPPHKWQLLSQSWLLRAKIYYLRRNFIVGVFYLLGYHLLSRIAALYQTHEKSGAKSLC